MIGTFREQDREGVIELWNREAVKIGYKEMTNTSFQEIFEHNPYFSEKNTFIMYDNSKIVGFACGCTGDDLPLGDVTGYITIVLLHKDYETTKNYTKLIQTLEASFQKNGKKQADILFFNPINLPWYIRGTNKHEHNNAPGVFKDSRCYEELLKLGYVERTTEIAMYLNLKDFNITLEMKEKEEKAKANQYHVELFEEDKHTGLVDMLGEFQNPLWEKEIKEAAYKKNPFLVASQNGKVVGFAGPIIKQVSGRGYFAGIGVNTAHEGYGLGTILFNKLCEEFKNIGTEYMSLYTGATNPAKNIYEKAGFKPVQEFSVMRKIFS